jgi:3-deoxy-D-manno-octulosonic-acid transferase
MELIADLDLKLLLLPHENSSNQGIAQIDLIEDLKNVADQNIVILNQRGVLSKLYRHADICFVGGAFRTGLHNTLEAAVYAKPVIFGPQYQKFPEAKRLIKCGGAFSASSRKELSDTLRSLIENNTNYALAAEAANKYIREQAGSSIKTAQKIKDLIAS